MESVLSTAGTSTRVVAAQVLDKVGQVWTVADEQVNRRLPAATRGSIGLAGLLGMLTASLLIFIKEGHTVLEERALDRAVQLVHESPIHNIHKDNEGQLVRVTGYAASPESSLTDPLFRVTPATRALKLKRKVSMYQWVEKEHTTSKRVFDGSEEQQYTYEYDTQWRSTGIKSKYFHDEKNHQNPVIMTFNPLELVASPITVGAFTLSERVVEEINWYITLTTGVEKDKIPAQTMREKALDYEGGFYMGNNPAKPAVGDTKLSWQVIPEQTITILAQQKGNTFEPYMDTTTGHTIFQVQHGDVPARTLLRAILVQHDHHHHHLWLYRMLALGIFFLSARGLTRPLQTALKRVPHLEKLAHAGQTIVTLVMAMTLTAFCILFTWLLYKPFYGFLLVALVGTFYCCQRRGGAGWSMGGSGQQGDKLAISPPINIDYALPPLHDDSSNHDDDDHDDNVNVRDDSSISSSSSSDGGVAMGKVI